MLITKRNGKQELFDRNKIVVALSKAFKASDYKIDHKVLDEIVNSIEIWEEITVENIQDQVEELLMDYDYPTVAKNYIIYRYEREAIRDSKKDLTKALTEKLQAKSISNQNANVDEYSFGGRIGEASRYVTKDYALNNCMSKMAKDNHLNNEIYIHDLDSYAVGMHNCLSIPFDDLLASGFITRQTDVRPANSINTAFQLVAVIFQIQSLQQFGR